MNDMALVQWVTGAMGVIVLVVGQRMPKFTQFGVGFGVAVSSVIYWQGIRRILLTAILLWWVCLVEWSFWPFVVYCL